MTLDRLILEEERNCERLALLCAQNPRPQPPTAYHYAASQQLGNRLPAMRKARLILQLALQLYSWQFRWSNCSAGSSTSRLSRRLLGISVRSWLIEYTAPPASSWFVTTPSIGLPTWHIWDIEMVTFELVVLHTVLCFWQCFWLSSEVKT